MKRLYRTMTLLLPLTGLGAWSGNACAAACTSIATGNWSAQTTWGAAGTGCAGATGGIPNTTADSVTIASPTVVTADIAVTVGAVTIDSGAKLNIAGQNWTSGATTISGTLAHTNTGGSENYNGLVTINSGGTWDNTVGESMNFRGGLINNGTFIGGTAGNCTFTVNAQTIGGTSPITMPNLRVNSGAVLTNSGTVTVSTALSTSAGSGTFVNDANATLNIGGTSTVTTLTASASGNTVNYTGTTQTVKLPSSSTYYNLTLSGSNTKTLPNSALTVSGDFTMSGSATATAAAALTVGGNFTIGAGNTFAGSTFTHNVAGNWVNNGTFTRGTSTINFNGSAAQTLGGTATTTFNNLTVANSGAGSTTLILNTSVAGNLSVNSGTLYLSTFTANRTAAGGTITVASGATLDIGGTNGFPSNYTTRTLGATSTVEYSGSNQTVLNLASPGYGNLTLSGSGTKTAAGSFITRGDLTISGVTLDSGAFTQTVNGNVNNSGTQTATSGSITLSGGTAAHTLSGSGSYTNLVLNDSNGATLAGSPVVSGVLTLTSGVLTTGSYTLEVSSSCAAGISGASSSSYVLGNLTLHYPTGSTTCTFPIGTTGVYAPASVTLYSVTSALANSSLTARTDAGDYTDTTAGASGITAGKSVNRYWTLTSGASLAFASYDTTFNFVAGEVDGGANTASFIIGRKYGGSWAYPTMGAKNATNTTASGMTQAGGFGVYVIGERTMPSITVLKTAVAYWDPQNLLANPKSIPGAVAQYTIIVNNSGGPADNNLTSLTDTIPAGTALYVGDIGGAGSGPVLFAQGASSSTLTYTFTSLNSSTDDLDFYGGATPAWGYVPVPGTDGCDPLVSKLRVNPTGTFVGSAVSPQPSFQLQFRVCVQ